MPPTKGIIHKTHYTTIITTPTHELIADEPVSNGGADDGLAPAELLAASLIACTCITMRMYADKKGFPMDSAEVTVDVIGNPDTKTTHISRIIQLTGNLTYEMKERILAIANKCPIHNILTNPITITTELR